MFAVSNGKKALTNGKKTPSNGKKTPTNGKKTPTRSLIRLIILNAVSEAPL